MTTIGFISFSASLNALTVMDIDVGNNHACVHFANYKAMCWGYDMDDGLGTTIKTGDMGDNPGEMVALIPIAFSASITEAIVQIECGNGSTCGTISKKKKKKKNWNE